MELCGGVDVIAVPVQVALQFYRERKKKIPPAYSVIPHFQNIHPKQTGVLVKNLTIQKRI